MTALMVEVDWLWIRLTISMQLITLNKI
jgi:hypothetical protein